MQYNELRGLVQARVFTDYHSAEPYFLSNQFKLVFVATVKKVTEIRVYVTEAIREDHSCHITHVTPALHQKEVSCVLAY